MISVNTKSRILSNHYAYEENEEVLVNALDLCEELIAHEQLQRHYKQLLSRYETLLALYEAKQCPTYRRINLKG